MRISNCSKKNKKPQVNERSNNQKKIPHPNGTKLQQNQKNNSKRTKKIAANFEVGDKVYAKDWDRSFKEAKILEIASNNIVVKFKSGGKLTLERTKIRRSPPDKSIIDYNSTAPTKKRKTKNKENIEKHLNGNSRVNEEISPINSPMLDDEKTADGHGEDVDMSNKDDEVTSTVPLIEIDCACSSNVNENLVKCNQCSLYQHINCLASVEDPHLCYKCSKRCLNIGDNIFYPFYMNQNGMFPDQTLNKLCDITYEKCSIIRCINQQQNEESICDIEKLEKQVAQMFEFPSKADWAAYKSDPDFNNLIFYAKTFIDM